MPISVKTVRTVKTVNVIRVAGEIGPDGLRCNNRGFSQREMPDYDRLELNSTARAAIMPAFHSG